MSHGRYEDFSTDKLLRGTVHYEYEHCSDLQQAAMRRSKVRREARKHVSSRVGGTDGAGRARAAGRDRPRTADGRDNHTRSSAGSAPGSQRRLEALTSHGVGRSLEFQFQVGRFARCPRVSAAPSTEPFPTNTDRQQRRDILPLDGKYK